MAVIEGTTSQVMLDAALKKAGMTEKDVTIVSVSATTAASAMDSGKVDAVAAWSPATDTIISKLGSKAKVLAKSKDFTSTIPLTCSWVVTPKYAKSNKSTILKSDKAMLQAMNYRYNGGKNAAKWIAKQLGLAESSVKTQITSTETLYSSKQLVSLINSGKLYTYYTKQEKAFEKLGLLKKSSSNVSAKDYVLADIIKQAAKAIE